MKIDMLQSIWMERYRPQLVQDLVLPQTLIDRLQRYVDNDEVPNIGLWSSNPGTGKTSVATALIKNINCEALFINASLENGIDILRGKIKKFATTVSFDDKTKIVVLDEVDNLSSDAQFAFRSFIETYSANCRFILTGNHKNKIIAPLLDRLENYDFNSFTKTEMIKPMFERLKFILETEKVQFDPKELVPILNTNFPSLRSMIADIQKFSISGTLEVDQSQLDGLDVHGNIMLSMKSKDYQGILQQVNLLNAPDSMYTYLYRESAKQFKPDMQPQVIVTIAKYQHMASSVRDKNLNLMACLSELMRFI